MNDEPRITYAFIILVVQIGLVCVIDFNTCIYFIPVFEICEIELETRWWLGGVRMFR